MSQGTRFFMVDSGEGEWLSGPHRDEVDATEDGKVVREVTDEVLGECRRIEKMLESMPGTEDEVTIRHRLAEILSVQVRDA